MGLTDDWDATAWHVGLRSFKRSIRGSLALRNRSSVNRETIGEVFVFSTDRAEATLQFQVLERIQGSVVTAVCTNESGEPVPVACLSTHDGIGSSSRWRRTGNRQPVLDLVAIREAGLAPITPFVVGAKMYNWSLLQAFSDAWFGRRAWDGYADPEYFTKLLLPGVSVPDTAVFKRERESPHRPGA
jgi:hypothetical protein